MRILMAAIAAVLSMTIMSPVQASPLEHIERKGNVIKVTDAESYAFYYFTRTTYRSECGETREITSKFHHVNKNGSAKIRVRNLPGTWMIHVSVIRGYGSSLVEVKRYVYEQS